MYRAEGNKGGDSGNKKKDFLLILHIGCGLVMAVFHVSLVCDPDSQSSPYLGFQCSHVREKTNHSVITLCL